MGCIFCTPGAERMYDKIFAAKVRVERRGFRHMHCSGELRHGRSFLPRVRVIPATKSFITLGPLGRARYPFKPRLANRRRSTRPHRFRHVRLRAEFKTIHFSFNSTHAAITLAGEKGGLGTAMSNGPAYHGRALAVTRPLAPPASGTLPAPPAVPRLQAQQAVVTVT